MFKKVGISLMAALMLSSVAFAGDFTSADDGDNKQKCKQEEKKVLKFDKEVVKKVMMEDGFDDNGANFMVAGYTLYDSRMQNTLDSYIVDRTISEEVIDGVSIRKVMDRHKKTFWNAFVLMGSYLKDPKGAEQLDNYGTIKSDQEEIDSLFKNNKAKEE